MAEPADLGLPPLGALERMPVWLEGGVYQIGLGTTAHCRHCGAEFVYDPAAAVPWAGTHARRMRWAQGMGEFDRTTGHLQLCLVPLALAAKEAASG